MQQNFNDLEDFLEDDSFRKWVYRTDEAAIAFWEHWLKEHPAQVATAETAAAFLRMLQHENPQPGDVQIDHASERLLAAIGAEKVKPMHTGNRRRWLRIAASVFVLLALALAYRYLVPGTPPLEKVATNYGQVTRYILPDSSEVALNANSTLEYPDNWKASAAREVWIKGEAFFHVKKTATRARFIVHTDAFDIEVTGTAFNVTNKGGKSSIALKEGSVKIHRPGQPDIIMAPGDFIEWEESRIIKKVVSKPDYMAWTENKLVFENTPLTKVAEKIKEHYGVEVKLAGPGVTEKTITGIMPNDNLTVLLQSLLATQEYIIEQNNQTITITTKN